MEADIEGSQRKVLGARVRPLKSAFGATGIPIRDGKTRPFVVSRRWSAPAGRYPETWYLVHPETGEVYLEGPQRVALIWGLQSATELTDVVDSPIELDAGTYKLVFALGGLKGGEVEVATVEAGTGTAA